MRTDGLQRAMRVATPLLTVITLAVTGVVASRHFALHEALSIVAAFTVALAVPEWIYRSSDRTHPAGHLVLLVAWAILVASALSNMITWGSLESPALGGDQDRYYQFALHFLDPSHPVNVSLSFPGLSVTMMLMWRVLGVSVLWPVAMNMAFTLTAMVIVALTTCRLLHERVQMAPAHLMTLAMALVCALFYYLSQGVLVLKEASVYMCMACVAFVLAGVERDYAPSKRWLWRDVLIFAAAVFMMGFFRTTYLYFVMLGVVVVCAPRWRTQWKPSALLLVLSAAAFWVGNNVAFYSIDYHMRIVEGGDLLQAELMSETPRQLYLDFIGYYFYYSPLHRLALLPLTASVQFIIPFPWIYTAFNLDELFPRMAWGWYAVGGVALFYYAWISWRRGVNLGAWAWWIALSFAIIAYITAGSVSRYVLPLEQLFVPVTAYVLCLVWEGRYRRPLLWWSIVFVVVLAVTLIVCHHIQTAYLNALDDFYNTYEASLMGM